MKSLRNLWLVLIILVMTIFVFIWIWYSPIRALFSDPQVLNNWLQQWGAWVPLITIGLHIVQVLFAPLPGTAIDTVNGLFFGPWIGSLYSMIGLQSGALIMLLLVRRFGRPMAERFIPPQKLQRFDQRVKHLGVLFIFLVFLMPFMPDDMILVLAGMTTISLPYLLLLSLVGRLPGVFFANWLGSHATSLSAGEWIVVAVIFLAAVIFFWWKHTMLEEKMTNFLENITGWWRNRKKIR